MSALEQLLTRDEYRTVTHVATGRSAPDQLPLVAWVLGFVNLEQLAALLDGSALVERRFPREEIP